MMTTDLGACEQFIYELRRSNLIERGQLDQVVEDFLRRNPRSDPGVLADHLVAQNVLTRFQAERVMQGKTQGLVLGPYVLADSVGQGSMGAVHRAISKNDNKVYAVKVLPRRSMWNVRLARRQVRSFGSFSHPTVVPFVDVGTSGGLHYLVWTFVDGEPLDAVVQRAGKLTAGATAAVGFQIAAGLNLAHQNGLFHGLIKPSNVLISPGPQVRILDFGIGSLLAENEGESLVDTMSTSNALTSGLDCASPESIMEPTNRTPAGDQYSLGCVLYYCLTGRYPFAEGSAVEKMMAHQFKQPTPLAELAPDAPRQLVAVVEKLMQKKPEDRYHGVDEAVEALQPLSGPMAGGAERHEPVEHSPVDDVAVRTPPPMRPMPAAFGTPVPVGSGILPNPAAPMPQLTVPTRRSMRIEVPAPMLPPPAAARATAPIVAPPPVAPIPSPFQAPPQNVILPLQPPARRPQLGPIGFLALGATVAVICFLAVHTLLK
jgi:serine/threonine-protein kinase